MYVDFKRWITRDIVQIIENDGRLEKDRSLIDVESK